MQTLKEKCREIIAIHPLTNRECRKQFTENICAAMQRIIDKYKEFEKSLEEAREVLPPEEYQKLLEELDNYEEED